MSKRKEFLSYFTTENGRKLVFRGAACITLSLFAGNFLPETVLLQYYREMVSSYKSGFERVVPKKVLDRLEAAYEKLDLHPYERKIIKPFHVYGFDIFEAGSTKYRFGAVLGVPSNFSYESKKDIDRAEIRCRNEAISWSSENGKLLQEAIILTEDEQMFGFCKAILQLQTHRPLLNSIFPSVSFLTVYSVGNYLNQRLNLYGRPIQVRMILYTLLGMFGLGAWSFMKDFSQVSNDSNIDKKLSELGPDFVDAGVRYYDKILKKNIALRNLIGDETYTAKGNLNFVLRQKSLPITLRKSFFEMRLEELKQLQVTDSSNSAQ